MNMVEGVGFVTLASREGPIRVRPEWVIAIGGHEDMYPDMRRLYLHGGAQLLVFDTTENLSKVVAPWPEAYA